MSCARPNTKRSNPKDLGELEKGLRDKLWTAYHYSPRYVDRKVYGLALVSGYRDPGRQWDLRHERTPGHECDPRYKGYPVTAVPATWNGREWVGGSKHQHRKAADIGGVDLMWLWHNCAMFGLWHTVSSEKWHYEERGNCTVPIIEYPGPCWDDPTTPIEEPLMVTDEDARKIRAIVSEEMDKRHNPDNKGNLLPRLRDDAATQDRRNDEIVRGIRKLLGRNK